MEHSGTYYSLRHFSEKKKIRMQMQQKKILWGSEIKKNNQRVLRVTPEKRNCAKHRIATPKIEDKWESFNTQHTALSSQHLMRENW